MIAGPDTLGVVAAALALLSLGYAIVGTMSVVPATSDGARRIWPILNIEAMIVGSVCVVFIFAPVLMPLAALALILRVTWEATTVRFRPGGAGSALIWAGMAGATFLVMLVMPWRLAVALVALVWLGTMLRRVLVPGGAGIEMLTFPVLPVIAFALAATGGPEALFLAAWIGIETFDSYALLSGKLFGRHKAFPKLSPNKTIEGLAGGALMLALTATGGALLLPKVGLGAALGFAALIGVFTIVGDLTASLIKRRAGVKDYPHAVPHQGGIFDIFDSWVATGGALALVLALVWAG